MPTCGQSKWLNFADGPVTELTAGQRVKFEIKVTAHHRGHFVFRLCNRTISDALGGIDGQEACLNQHTLERVRPDELDLNCMANDKRGDCQPVDEANPGYWYLPPASDGDTINSLDNDAAGPSSLAQVSSHSERAGAYYTFHYKLPAGFTCEKCTMQWWWLSANSCTPHPDAYKCYFGKMQEAGWDASKWCGGGACSYSGSCPAQQGGTQQCGEQFKNCADLKIVQPGAPGATQPVSTQPPSRQPESTQPPATQQPGATQAPNPTTTEPEPESEEEEEESEEEEGEEEEEEEEVKCFATPGNGGGATDEACKKCSTGYQWWPCSGDLCSCVGGGGATTTAAPPATGTCVANPAKIVSNGVTDQECQKCASGYKWWPCNQDHFCICGESLLAEVKEHRFLGLIQQSDEVQLAAFEGDAGERGEEL